jgi:N,N'-diacetyllegionaminate synthase
MKMTTFECIKIGTRNVGPGHPCFIVAEVAQAHEGSLEKAHAYIDVVAKTGVDAVKFQTHIASEESTPSEPWRVKFTNQFATRYDYWKHMEFSESAWRELAAHAHACGLIFLSSPFSVAAVDLLDRVGMPAWKIGAGEITSQDVLDRVIATGRPVLLSNGMCTWSELDETVRWLRKGQVPFAIYQCTTAYPCPPEQIGLNILQELADRYGCPVGLSDHSGTIYAGLAAVALGAHALEIHVKLTEKDQGPDAAASLIPAKLERLVNGVRFIEQARENPVDKDAMVESLGDLRQTFRKKMVTCKSLHPGHVLVREDIVFKKGGPGLGADQLPLMLGKVVKQAVKADEVMKEEHFE